MRVPVLVLRTALRFVEGIVNKKLDAPRMGGR
jgi:hypothetical protein